MARRRRFEKKVEEAEINITPMLDMVFIMLIFFIVSTSFVRVAGINVNRPSKGSQNKVVKQSKIVLIQIKNDGTIEVSFGNGSRTVDLAAVRPEVEKDLAGNPDAQVVVAVSPGSRAGLMVEAIDRAKQAGAKNVSLASTQS
ncbi:MAG: ExbD/TolR family protein [Gammaproteobacteria bacterium]